ncbi:MAG: glutamate--tRNA ligase family protein, partial [Pseudomonadota bacterium]
IEYGITHVVRGEDHVTNSGAQIEIFQALGGTAPIMAHTPLLIGADGAALSKRLGSLSMDKLREAGVFPMAITSLLAKVGTSDNIALGQDLAELADNFTFDKIGRAPARFDEKELDGLNADLLRGQSYQQVKADLADIDPRAAEDPMFWETVKANCSRLADVSTWVEIVYGHITPVIEQEDADYIQHARDLMPKAEFDEGTWKTWTGDLKEKTGRKGKGLFMPLRKALTGVSYGPDMSLLLQLIGRKRASERLG